MSTTTTETLDSLANAVLYDWETAIDRFFSAVELKRNERELTVEDARRALVRGYGEDVADAWDDWNNE